METLHNQFGEKITITNKYERGLPSGDYNEYLLKLGESSSKEIAKSLDIVLKERYLEEISERQA